MRSHVKAVLAALLLLVASKLPAAGYTQYPAYPPSGVLPSTRFNVIWEGNAGAAYGYTDYMTTNSYSIYVNYPGIGQTFYIPSSGDGLPLYGLFNGYNDHMTSMLFGEGGYNTEVVLGFPYSSSSAVPGLSQIARFVNGVDHATYVDKLSINGYSEEGGFGYYGYKRWTNNDTHLTSPFGGTVQEQSDLIAGGAIYSWTWNNIQFVNHGDYGRYIQSAFFFSDPGASANAYQYNPDEAGNEILSNSADPYSKYLQRGSPLLFDGIVGGAHQTRSAPVEFFDFNIDGDVDHLRIYTSTIIGKDLTMGWNGIDQVAHYVARINVPVAITNPSHKLSSAVPAIYLNAEFNYSYSYDAANDQVVCLATQSPVATQPTDPNACRPLPPSCQPSPAAERKVVIPNGRGGVIMAKPDGSGAMGIYGVSSSAGGKIGYFTMVNFTNPPSNDCGNTTTMAAWSENDLVAGDNQFSTYIVTGTLDDVRRLMRELKDLNAN